MLHLARLGERLLVDSYLSIRWIEGYPLVVSSSGVLCFLFLSGVIVSVGRLTQYLRIAGIQSLTIIPLDTN